MLYTSVLSWVANAEHFSLAQYPEYQITLNALYFSFESSAGTFAFSEPQGHFSLHQLSLHYRTCEVSGNRLLGNRKLLAFIVTSSFCFILPSVLHILSLTHPSIYPHIYPSLIHQILELSRSPSILSSLSGETTMEYLLTHRRMYWYRLN